MSKPQSAFEIAARQIQRSRRPEELFGDETADTIANIFKQLIKVVHPDLNIDTELATALTARLTELYDQALNKLANNTYGHKEALMSFKTKHHSYQIFENQGTSGIANVMSAIMDDKHHVDIHIASSVDTNEFIAQEARAIYKLRQTTEHGAIGYHSMLPRLIECVEINIDHQARKANIFESMDPGFVSLAQIAERYKDEGIHGKDVAWMLRRALDVLGYSHSLGIIHGGLNPANIFIGTDDLHDVIITNWQNACLAPGDIIRSIDKNYRHCVAPEVFKKVSPTTAIDMFALGQSFLEVCGTATSKRVTLFLKSFAIISPSQRPRDAFEMRNAFTQMIKELWDNLQYHPFIFS